MAERIESTCALKGPRLKMTWPRQYLLRDEYRAITAAGGWPQVILKMITRPFALWAYVGGYTCASCPVGRNGWFRLDTDEITQ